MNTNYIEELKESVPEFLFCNTQCRYCYGRQYESIDVDSGKEIICRKLNNRVNKQAKLQSKLQSKLVDKFIKDNKEKENG